MRHPDCRPAAEAEFVFDQVSVIQDLAYTDWIEDVIVSLCFIVCPGFGNFFEVLGFVFVLNKVAKVCMLGLMGREGHCCTLHRNEKRAQTYQED
jgi:hypothetical protein